ncbi:hypothetical protein [Streptomyces murinus]|uniref:hypothetical protein n=1 Tax=Streptomyces murinus TaxID=33900 RepID=UPI003813A2C3
MLSNFRRDPVPATFDHSDCTPQEDEEWQEGHECSDELLHAALDRVEQLERTAKAAEREHGELRRRLARLERQLGALLAARTEQRDDLAGVEHSDHQDIARRFRTLIEQRFQNFARRYADKSVHTMDRPERERVTRLISLLSTQVFTDAIPLSPGIRRELGLPEEGGHIEQAIANVRRDGCDLAERIHRAGLSHRWDFEHRAGVPLDPARQEAWPSCDSQAPVRFVISPAYVVNGVVYCPQYVYTGELDG